MQNKMVLFCFDQHIERFNAPFLGLLMRVEKHIQVIPFNQTSTVFNLDGLIVVVAGNNHLRSESISLIGSSKNIARSDSVIAGRNPIRMASATPAAGTIGRYPSSEQPSIDHFSLAERLAFPNEILRDSEAFQQVLDRGWAQTASVQQQNQAQSHPAASATRHSATGSTADFQTQNNRQTPPAALPSKGWIKGLPHTPHVSDDCNKHLSRLSPILPMSEPFQTNNIRGLKPNLSAVSYKQNYSPTLSSLDLLEKAFLGRKTNVLFPKCTLAYPYLESIQQFTLFSSGSQRTRTCKFSQFPS